MTSTVFLGGGRITSAMLAGLRLAGHRQRLIVHDVNRAKLQRLKRDYGVGIEPSLAAAVVHADAVIVAVRPDSVGDLLAGVRAVIGRRRRKRVKPLLAVSFAAGVPLARLRKASSSDVLWTRAMPSPLCRSGQGLTALVFDRRMPRPARARIRGFFRQVGSVLEIPEKQFDAFTVNYSSSYGYHALATLVDAAVASGLDRKTALLSAAHALADGITAWRSGKVSLDRLLQEAATPGGIAETTMAAMDRSGYRRAVEAGFRAGLARARANAKPL
jgi:pyrroline-5-carboxylate reductase